MIRGWTGTSSLLSASPAPISKLTQPKLERHLWQAADILRYIFGLLFYKRLCDVWDEEFEALLAETGDQGPG